MVLVAYVVVQFKTIGTLRWKKNTVTTHMRDARYIRVAEGRKDYISGGPHMGRFLIAKYLEICYNGRTVVQGGWLYRES